MVCISPAAVEASIDWKDRGNAHLVKGELDAAMGCYSEAIAINPRHAEAYNNAGIVLYQQGRFDDAHEKYRKAISLKPNLANAHFNLHLVLLDSVDLVPSIQCLRKAVEYDPANARFNFFLGLFLDYVGNSEQANVYFGRLHGENGEYQANLDAWRHIKSRDEKFPKIATSIRHGFEIAFDAANKEGLVLEFGVRFGESIGWIAELTDREVHGFDSFEGLPEDWHDEPKGSYSTDGIIPDVPQNVTLHKGWFNDSLPDFIARHREPIRFMNVDCDLYSSTKTVLELLSTQIVQGTVIAFDEYIGNEHWREDEFKAFQEAAARYGWEYEYLCFSFMTKQVVVRITSQAH